MTAAIDLNMDMGEGFGAWRIGNDADLMPLISSVNLAAGFHAGDPSTMARTLEQAADHDVAVGVHPGFRDLVGFGRRHIDASAEELTHDVLYQLGALRELATHQGLSLHHLKLHGALFMHAAADDDFAQTLCRALSKTAPDLPLYGLPGTALDRAAAQQGLHRVHEFYADRDYDRQGRLVFVRRQAPLDPQAVAERVLRACREGKVETVEGEQLDVAFASICIHSDTPGALALVQRVRHTLDEAGVAIAPWRAP